MAYDSAYPSLVQSALKKRPIGYEAAAQHYGRIPQSSPYKAAASSILQGIQQPTAPTPAPLTIPQQSASAVGGASGAGGAGDSGAERIWAALNAHDAPDVNNWVDQNKAAITGGMIPAALSHFPSQTADRIAQTLEGKDWRSNYYYNIAHSGFGGAPVYNRTGAGDTARLVSVPGYAPAGVAGALSGTDAGSLYGRYDPQGRYLGFLSGLIGGNWVY